MTKRFRMSCALDVDDLLMEPLDQRVIYEIRFNDDTNRALEEAYAFEYEIDGFEIYSRSTVLYTVHIIKINNEDYAKIYFPHAVEDEEARQTIIKHFVEFSKVILDTLNEEVKN